MITNLAFFFSSPTIKCLLFVLHPGALFSPTRKTVSWGIVYIMLRLTFIHLGQSSPTLVHVHHHLESYESQGLTQHLWGGWSLSFLVKSMLSMDQTFSSKDIHVIDFGPIEASESNRIVLKPNLKYNNLHQSLSLFWKQIMQSTVLYRLTSQAFKTCPCDLLSVSLWHTGMSLDFPLPLHTTMYFPIKYSKYLILSKWSHLPRAFHMWKYLSMKCINSFRILDCLLIHQHRFSLW